MTLAHTDRVARRAGGLRQPAGRGVPPLRNGDNLDADEFHRRYEAMPPGTRAELIEGIVYLMPSPVRMDQHAEPHAFVVGWLMYYKSKTPVVRVGDNPTDRLDNRNEPQPDAILMLPQTAGGGAGIDEKGYLMGSPELVCEVAASTASIDLNQKLRVYQRHRVPEYLVWRTEDGQVDWFELRDARYARKAADPADGLLKSGVFPGLWLDVDALAALDVGGLFAGVDAGAGTPEHAAFVAKLNATRTS